MTDAAPPAHEGLVELHARPPIREYIRELWQRRHYATVVPLRALRTRNMNNVLGVAWFLLNPALLVATYYVFFGLILDTSRGVPNFITFLAAGVFTFSFMQRSVASISSSITSNMGLVRAIRFPRALLPIANAIEQLVAQLPVIVILLFVALVTGEPVRWQWIVLLPALLMQALFALGLGFALARLATNFRDIQQFLPFVFRLIFYMSGVLYSVDRFVTDPALRRLFLLNPFYDHIKVVRWGILGGDFPLAATLTAAAVTLALLPIGFFVFRAGEPYGGGGG